MKVFISQPMRDLSEEEILDKRTEIFDSFCKLMSIKYPDIKIELIDNYTKQIPDGINDVENRSVWCLGDSIRLMAEADMVIFDTGYYEARGCWIEYEICNRYGIPYTKYEDHSFTISYEAALPKEVAK